MELYCYRVVRLWLKFHVLNFACSFVCCFLKSKSEWGETDWFELYRYWRSRYLIPSPIINNNAGNGNAQQPQCYNYVATSQGFPSKEDHQVQFALFYRFAFACDWGIVEGDDIHWTDFSAHFYGMEMLCCMKTASKWTTEI